MQSVAALIRFWEEAQHLGVEWTDGSILTVYVTPARDALLAALLDAAQTAAGRPIPVLAEPTPPGTHELPTHAPYERRDGTQRAYIWQILS